MTEPQTAVDILRAARKLIEKEENWTRVAYARDKNSEPVRYNDQDAVCFCFVGAVYRAAKSDFDETGLVQKAKAIGFFVQARYDELYPATVYSVSQFHAHVINDTLPHARVLANIDKAITLAERDHASAS